MQKMAPPQKQAVLGFGVMATAIYLLLWHLARATAALPQANLIALGAAGDLLVTVPLLYYWLLVRPGHSSSATLAAVVLTGARTAGLLFPGDTQGWHAALRWVALPLELWMIAAVVQRMRRIDRSQDVATRLRAASNALVRDHRVAELLAAELEVFYFALFSWRAKPDVPRGWQGFPAGEASGFCMLSMGLGAALLFEGIAMHLMLTRWSHTAAWVATAFDGYALIWVTALARSLRLQPMLTGESSVVLRLGLLWRIEVSREAVLECRRVDPTSEVPRRLGVLSLVKLNQPQWVVEFREPVSARGPYGLRRQVTSVVLAVDDAAGFGSAMNRSADPK